MSHLLIMISWFKMQYKRTLSTLAIILFSVIIALIVILGLASVTELFIAIIGALVLAIVGAAWWGFKDKIEVRNKDFYSPIHAMIVKVNIETPREQALAFSGIGKWVNVKQLRIDFQSISTVFTQHATKFKKEDLIMWDAIEKQINAYSSGGGFFINKDVQKWFDDLETKYNH